MTAINLFVQGSSAYLITDGAMTGLDGRLLAVQNKVLCLPSQRLAICTTGWMPVTDAEATSGSISMDSRLAALRRVGYVGSWSQAQTLNALPAVLYDLHQRNLTAFADQSAERSDLLMAVAAWDPVDSTAKAYLAATEPGLGPMPYSLNRVHCYFTSGAEGMAPDAVLKAALRRPAQADKATSFNVRRDGLRLLEWQRGLTDGPCGDGFHAVGGKAYLTRVTSAGVVQETLHTWEQDRIGEPIAAKNDRPRVH